MNGEWVEINVQEGDLYPIHPKRIEVFELPEVRFSIKKANCPAGRVDIEILHYKLVINNNGTLYYEHLQSTSQSPRGGVPR